MKCLEADGDGCCRTAGHKEVLAGKICAETAVDAGGNGLPDLGQARRNGIAVELAGIHGVQDIYYRRLYRLRGRHIGIADRKIINIFRANLCRPLFAVFKNRPDCRFFCAKSVHFFRNHDTSHPLHIASFNASL